MRGVVLDDFLPIKMLLRFICIVLRFVEIAVARSITICKDDKFLAALSKRSVTGLFHRRMSSGEHEKIYFLRYRACGLIIAIEQSPCPSR